MRLIVARCEVTYSGRLNAFLPESTRLLMVKDDGSVLVHADAGGFKPLNWMTPPTVIEDGGDLVVVRKRAGKSEDRLEIKLIEVLSDVTHDMGEAAGLEKDGVERDLQLLLADDPTHIDRRPSARQARVADRRRPRRPDVPRRGRRLGRGRDQAGRDDRRGRAAHALPRLHPRRPVTRGVPRLPRRAVDQAAGDRARRPAWDRCVQVDLAVLRGEREPELTLFG